MKKLFIALTIASFSVGTASSALAQTPAAGAAVGGLSGAAVGGIVAAVVVLGVAVGGSDSTSTTGTK